MALMNQRRSFSHRDQPPLHECVTGDKCHPTWLDTAGPGVELPFGPYEPPAPDPAATVLVTTRVIYQGHLVAIPGNHITPANATLWGVPQ